jgi:hypothetical protein
LIKLRDWYGQVTEHFHAAQRGMLNRRVVLLGQVALAEHGQSRTGGYITTRTSNIIMVIIIVLISIIILNANARHL